MNRNGPAAVIDHGTSLNSICDDITSTSDRKRILAIDPRCKWMFKRFYNHIQSRPPTLAHLIAAVRQLEPTQEILDNLENIQEFLEHSESLDLNDEVDDILYSLGLDAKTVRMVSDHAGLLTTSSIIGDSKKSLPLDIRRTLLTCKGAWCPTIFAYVRQYPELFYGEVLTSGADPSPRSTLKTRVVSQSQAQRLKRFFGIRHAEPLLAKHPNESGSVESVPLDESANASRNTFAPADFQEALVSLKPQMPQSVESESVRGIVQDIIKKNDMRLGVISVALVLSKAQDAGAVLTKQRLMAMTLRLDDVIVLDDDWLGRTEIQDGNKRLLTEHLAAQILSVVDRIPVDILHAQLGKSNSTYKAMTTKAISAYFHAHPGFRVQGEIVRAATTYRYTASSEVSPLENNLWRSMSKVMFPLDESAIDARYTGRPALKPGPRDRALRSSPLFVKTDDGHFALTDSTDLHAIIRAESEFITPYLSAEEENEDEEELATSEFETEDETEQWQPDVEASDFTAETRSGISEVAPQGEEPRQFGETRTEALTIREIISQVRSSDLQIPEIQRSYVWKTTQVKDLFDSLYNGYPIGTLLVWETEERLKGKRLGSTNYFDSRIGTSTRFLLDGQQRTTSIVNAIDGRGPNVYFNVLDEHGSFRTSRAQVKLSARSIPIAGLDSESVDSLMDKIGIGSSDPSYDSIRTKLKHLVGILDRKISVEALHGFDYGEATDVFIRVNSRGTKLKNAELAIANLAYRLPGTVGVEIQRFSDELSVRGWEFSVPYIIRLITAVATQRVSYTGLNAVGDREILDAWKSVQSATRVWLEQLREQLGITSEDVLAGKNSHIVPIAWMARHGKSRCTQKLMYWFVLSAAFSRYSGTTDTNLDQDLRCSAASDEETFVDLLLAPLRSRRATLRLEPVDVERAGRQSALRTLMYLGNLHIATENLFGPDRVASLQQPPIPMTIIPNQTLKSLGFEPGSRWSKDGGLINTIFVDPEFEADDVITAARGLRSEQRYQHGLPVISVYRNNSQVHEFFAHRGRLLLDHFNDVLNELEQGHLSIRHVERPAQVTGRGRRELNHKNLPFDHPRRMMYDTIRKRILELDPSVTEIETEVYIGFTHSKVQRPFATIAKRKSVLNFTVDAHIDEISDPKGICRDVTSIGKHGIGNTGFAVKRMDEVVAVFDIIEQIMDIHT